MHKIINADIYASLKYLEDNSVDIAITSPPYWSQRNYGYEKQIGNESTQKKYVSRLNFLFSLLKDKLTEKGVFFLNIGDKYIKKYGQSPLGLIPYKLAYFMQKSGWILNDTIIWYKPNHMPSSVKNRFVNSYEPIFVFSKNSNNYFNDYRKNTQNYKNIIDVNLQPTPYKHVAVYPEKLVSKLLDLVSVKHNYTVLDPFAGSGTTLKVLKDRNENMFYKYIANGNMIEYKSEYVEIMKQRTGLKNLSVLKLPFKDYNYPPIEGKANINNDTAKLTRKIDNVNICETKDEFYSILHTIETDDFIKDYQKEKILFVGIKQFEINDIYNISLLKKWIIRNQIVVRGKKWFPIFMLVHDNKISRYNFNYKSLPINHKNTQKITYENTKFIGRKVVDNLSENKKIGYVKEIISEYKNHLPKYVKVVWENGLITKEYVINDEETIEKNIKFHRYNGYMSIKEVEEFVKLNKVINRTTEEEFCKYKKHKILNNYNGKFKKIDRKNWGASPGARSSLEEAYLSVSRLYRVKQNIIADYLNFLRKRRGLTKKGFAELFPRKYKYTVGHWLRKDFGGSIPIIDDWKKIEERFDVGPNIKKYACKTGLKFQTVSKTKYKIPEDVIDEDLIKYFTRLN